MTPLLISNEDGECIVHAVDKFGYIGRTNRRFAPLVGIHEFLTKP
jgi:hypothetical protein